MEQYGTFLWIIVTIVLVILCIIAFALQVSKYVEKGSKKARSSLKEKVDSHEIKKVLEEKKDSILSPQKNKDEETESEFQSIIQEVIEEFEQGGESTEKEETNTSKNTPETEPATKLSSKTKGQIEQIISEAEKLKEEGKFEEYEKKIIE